jgi:hypothetical protein
MLPWSRSSCWTRWSLRRCSTLRAKRRSGRSVRSRWAAAPLLHVLRGRALLCGGSNAAVPELPAWCTASLADVAMTAWDADAFFLFFFGVFFYVAMTAWDAYAFFSGFFGFFYVATIV